MKDKTDYLPNQITKVILYLLHHNGLHYYTNLQHNYFPASVCSKDAIRFPSGFFFFPLTITLKFLKSLLALKV